MSAWVPNQEAWDKFLSFLDVDRDVAGEKYEDIRKRLILYFERRKCLSAEDMADETLTRMIKRIYEGAVIDNMMGYLYGVARIVRLESFVVERREDSIKKELLRDSDIFVSTPAPDLLRQCFKECLGRLSSEHHQFIIRYYQESRRAKIDNRKSIAQQFEVSQNTIVLRAYHIRKTLEKCVKSCLKRLQ